MLNIVISPTMIASPHNARRNISCSWSKTELEPAAPAPRALVREVLWGGESKDC